MNTEAVIFKIAADATQVQTGLNKSRQAIEAHVARESALFKKAAAEKFVTDKAGYETELKNIRATEKQKITELLAASRKRDAINEESARRRQYLINREADQVKGAERAKEIAIKRRQELESRPMLGPSRAEFDRWRQELESRPMLGPSRAEFDRYNAIANDPLRQRQREDQARRRNADIAAGSGGYGWVGRDAKTGKGKVSPSYHGVSGTGAMVGGQIAGSIAAGDSVKDVSKMAGEAALFGLGASAGSKVFGRLINVIRKPFEQGLMRSLKGPAMAAGAGGAALIVGSGVAGVGAGLAINKKFITDVDNKSAADADDSKKILAGKLSKQIMAARAQGKFTEAEAVGLMKDLEGNSFRGIGRVQKSLGRVGVQSASDRAEERLKAQLGDQGKGTLGDLAGQARSMTGMAHRKNYTLTARMKGALKIEDLEEQARVAWERGDDKSMQKFQQQANQLRSASWMNLRANEKNPQAKMLTQLEIIASRLQPVEEMAKTAIAQSEG